MKRILATILVLIAIFAVFIQLGASQESDSYLVRGVFDNGAFVVEGEDVRVAGANVGSVKYTDVAMPEEEVRGEEGEPSTAPGKAIVVMEITDPAFRDFRQDASCLIRPQSLIGEKYIDCRPTMPRSPGTEPPPPLEEVPDGDPGEGEHLLPLENNGKTVDVDLLNNIMRRPYAERLRLILTDLGAALAGRGDDVAEIVRRGEPVLRDTNRVINSLAVQNRQLAQLAADSDAILEPFAREREHVSGFVTNAGIAAEATAERGADLEASLARFPEFLREFDATMRTLRTFSDEAYPVAADFADSAGDLTTATRRFKPFTLNSIKALDTLGDATTAAAPKLNEARPVIRRATSLAKTGAKPLTDSARMLGSFRERRGFEALMDLIYNTSLSMNGFDDWGHYLRSVVVPVDCFQYTAIRSASGCGSNFIDRGGGKKSVASAAGGIPPLSDQAAPAAGAGLGSVAPPSTEAPPSPEGSAGLLDFLLKP
jgi:phospholipid/cholesterol/gamma-HCH transport system substrate-binding protein